MISTDRLRPILWASAAFNVFGAYLLAFPAAPLGQLAGLPLDVPLPYRALAAAFVLEFGAAYAWLAVQPQPNRPLLVLGAAGKAIAFFLIFAIWLSGQIPLASVAAIS